MTIVAVIFIVRKLLDSSVDYSTLFKMKNFFPIVVVIVVQSIIVITNAIPWNILVNTITGEKINFTDTIMVYVKSNLMKYVPGNVFQYVGRNEIALKKNLSHIKVATATVLDVMITVLAAAIISLLFLYDYIFKFIEHTSWAHIALITIVIVLLLAIFVIFIFRKKLAHKFKKYDYLISKKNIKGVLLCLVYYIIVLMISSLMYLVVMIFVLDVSLTPKLFLNLFSAYTLAWLVGFITPGAPAGIGIKEAVMVGVTGGLVNVSDITLSMVVLRILLTIADLVAVGIGKTIDKRVKNKKEVIHEDD